MQTIPLTDFDGRHDGEAIHVVACGPTLWNWPPSYFHEPTCIFVNTAVHYAMRCIPWEPRNSYRVLFDQNSVYKYIENPYYVKNLLKPVFGIPKCHTFQPIKPFTESMLSLDRWMIGTTWTTFTFAIPDPWMTPLGDDRLWAPTAFAAIALAIRMGASQICLVGFDYGVFAGATHWDKTVNIDPKIVDRVCHFIRSRMQASVMPYCEEKNILLRRYFSPRIEVPILDRYHNRAEVTDDAP